MSPHVPACAGFTSGTRSRRSRTWDHLRSRGVYDRDFKAAGDVLGSSPLARGLLEPLGPADIAYGIIPARAGFTPSTRRQSRSTSGSSPLARGLRRPARPPHLHDRIIPARAGFTARSWSPTPWPTDHPRSRGVYTRNPRLPAPSRGSSPLARGLRVSVRENKIRLGIIPARAGFTIPGGVILRETQDHPRSRGVYGRSPAAWAPLSGSSPLARGLPRRRPGDLRRRRIIPARAGFTRRSRRGRRPATDHPRSRGVYTYWTDSHQSTRGSSPLARGLQAGFDSRSCFLGIIPARAGFTETRLVSYTSHLDHPRSRGVYGSNITSWMIAGGSSPLARGLPLAAKHARRGHGIIPARAGFTSPQSRRGRVPRDHPRSRGVYDSARQEVVRMLGSSPLARGLLSLSVTHFPYSGIIPARAGFTSNPGRRSWATGDHPRSRGVYGASGREIAIWGGSSPLARGLRTGPGPGHGPPGIIPARAGFTSPRS